LQADFDSHTGDTNNPHQVTAAQVGAYTTTEVDNLITGVNDSLDTKADLSGATFTGTISAPVIQSGGTDLYSIFLTTNDGNDITRVQPGQNTTTGGTPNEPTVNVVDSPSFNNITFSGTASGGDIIGTNVSGTTFFSGGTDLSTIIANSASGDITRVQNGLNTYTGGTGNLPTINISAATLDHLTVSGDTILDVTSATTIAVLNSTTATTEFYDYNNNYIESGVSLSNIVGGQNNRIPTGSNNIQIIGGNGITGSTDGTTYVENFDVNGNMLSGGTNLYDIFPVSKDGIDVFDYQSNNESSGRLWGGVITSGSTPGTVNISEGQGVTKLDAAGLSDIPTGINQGQGSTRELVTWSAQTDFVLAGVGYNLIYWDASAGQLTSSLKENFYSEFDFTRDFTIGRVYNNGSTVIARLCGMNLWNFDRRVQMFGEERFPIERATGLNIGNTTPASLQFEVSSGVLWAELVNRFPISGFTGGDTFTYWYQDGGTGFTSVSATQINNTQYDNGTGTLATLSNNRYGVHWVYAVHDSTYHVVYGRDSYTLSEAEIAPTPSTLPGLLDSYATLIGKIVVSKNDSTFTTIQSAFEQTFTPGTVSNHNDLGGIQGGTLGEYYHLTAAQQSFVQGLAANPTYPYDMTVAASDETTAITTGTAKVTFLAPRDFTLTGLTATFTTTGSTDSVIDVNYNGTSVLATPLTIPSGNYYSATTTTTSAITQYNTFSVDIDTAGTDATGFKVILLGYSNL
jgi:hypothetical protein